MMFVATKRCLSCALTIHRLDYLLDHVRTEFTHVQHQHAVGYACRGVNHGETGDTSPRRRGRVPPQNLEWGGSANRPPDFDIFDIFPCYLEQL